MKCQRWKRSPREWYCDVCGDIHTNPSTRQRKIGDRSMDLSCIYDDDDDESSSAEDLDVNVCSLSDDEISYGTVRDGNAVGTRQTLTAENSVLKLVREGASPMRKRRRLSLECASGKSPSFSGNNGSQSKISQDTPSCSGTQFNGVPPQLLLVLSETIFGSVAATSQGSTDMAKQRTNTDESETISIDSDSASESSVELITTERKPELLDLKRRPISKRGKNRKSENDTSLDELVIVASSKSPSKRTLDLSTTAEKRGIDIVAADSSAISVKVEEDTEPASDSKTDLVESDEDSCIITNVVKKPCPFGNDKFGMKCHLNCCNPKIYCNFHQFSTSTETKDLQITTVSSTSGAICDHLKEKSSPAMEKNSPSDHACAVADNEEKAQVCSVGTNTLRFKPSSSKEHELTTTRTKTTQTLFPKGRTPVSSSRRKKKLNLRGKKSGNYQENSSTGLCSLREHSMPVNHKCSTS